MSFAKLLVDVKRDKDIKAALVNAVPNPLCRTASQPLVRPATAASMEDGKPKPVPAASVCAAKALTTDVKSRTSPPPSLLFNLSPEQRKAICELCGIGPDGLALKREAAGAVGSSGASTGGGLKSKHHVDSFSATAATVDATNAGYIFPVIPLNTGGGNESWTRIGNTVRLRRFILRGQINWSATVVGGVGLQESAQGAPVKFVIVRDKCLPIGAPIYGENSTPVPVNPNSVYFSEVNISALNTMMPFNYLTKHSRFEIVHEHIHNPKWNNVPVNTGAETYIGATERFEINHECDVLQPYIGAGAGIPWQNTYFVWWMTDNGGGGQNPAIPIITIDGMLDMTFEDYQQ